MEAVQVDEQINGRERAGSVPSPLGATTDLVTFGEPLICLTAANGRLPSSHTLVKSVGGAESNVAIGLSRLGMRVSLLSRVGSDPFGDEVIRTLRGEGVDVDHVTRSSDRPTALLIKERQAPEDVHVYYYRQGSAATEITAGHVPADFASSGRHLHLSGITLLLGAGPRQAADTLLDQARAAGRSISFDPNFRRKLADIEDCVHWSRVVLPYVDHLLVGEDEAHALTGATSNTEALDALRSAGVANVVIRCGARGAIGADDNTTYEAPALRVPVVDTVGAGDAFTAGYLYETLCGNDLRAAMDTGTWAASRVVAHVGDYEGLPTIQDYHHRVADRPQVKR